MKQSLSVQTILLGFIITCIPSLIYPQPAFPESALKDDSGFDLIFDGKSLDDWDGDQTYWRAENDAIIGEVTPETILERNSFLIWRKEKPADFELKLEFRISAEGNSGINYRSEDVPGIPLALKGYQVDIDGKGQWTGQNYEERGRGILALRGQVCRIDPGKKPMAIGSPGEREDLLEFLSGDWNEVHLIVRGNVMIHMINGHVMSVVIDDDDVNRTMEGVLGVQVHVGPPMKVEYRNIRYKKL